MQNGELNVGVRRPLCSIGEIGCGHRRYKLIIPSREDVTKHGKRRRGWNSCAILDSMLDRLAYLITIGEGYIIAVSCVVNIDNRGAVSLNGYVLIGIRIGKALVGLLICRSVQGSSRFRTNGLGFGYYPICTVKALNVVINSYVSTCYLPLCNVGALLCRHGFRKLRAPAGDLITRYLEIRRSNRTLIRKLKNNVLTCTGYVAKDESDYILVSGIINTDFGRSVIQNDLLVCTYISSTHNILLVLFTIKLKLGSFINDFALYLNVAIAVECGHHMSNLYRNGIEYLPSRNEGEASCRHSLGKLFTPSGMNVTRSLEDGSSTEGCTIEVLLSYRCKLISVDILNSISVSVIDELVNILTECIRNLVVHRRDIGESFICRGKNVIQQIQLNEGRSLERPTLLRIGLAIKVHNLMNNGNLGLNGFEQNANYRLFGRHSFGKLIDLDIFAVLKGVESAKRPCGIELLIIVDRFGNTLTILEKYACITRFPVIQIVVIAEGIRITCVIDVKNCRSVRINKHRIVFSQGESVIQVLSQCMLQAEFLRIGASGEIFSLCKSVALAVKTHDEVSYLVGGVGRRLIFCIKVNICRGNGLTLVACVINPFYEIITRILGICRRRRERRAILEVKHLGLVEILIYESDSVNVSVIVNVDYVFPLHIESDSLVLRGVYGEAFYLLGKGRG